MTPIGSAFDWEYKRVSHNMRVHYEVVMKSGSNGRPAKSVATAASKGKVSGISPFPDTLAERQIGLELQALYDKIVAEPLPDQLVDLLRKLSSEPDKKS